MNRKYGHKGPVYDAARTVALAQPRVRQAATVPWLSDATPTWTGKHTFNAGVTLAGATTVNVLTVPDNIADAFSIEDAGGLEYLRVVSTDANPYVLVSRDLRLGLSVNSDYLFTERGTQGVLAIQNQIAAKEGSAEFFAKDGDGTDHVLFSMYGVGTPADVDNRERLQFGWNKASGLYMVRVEANGTGTNRALAIDATENLNQLYLDTAGGVYINDTANANMTQGLTVNQGANDNEILALKSSDVAHSLDSLTELDTFMTIRKSEAVAGGAEIVGYKDSDGTYQALALWLVGRLGEAAETTKTVNALGVVTLSAERDDGIGGATDVGADGNLVVIRNHNTARFIFDAEGSAHADVEFVAFSDHDDAALLADLEDMALAWRDPVKAEASGWLAEKREALEALNLAHFDPELPGHVMLNLTRLQMLLVGACRQQAARIKALEARCN